MKSAGMGILSHHELTEAARAAADEQADLIWGIVNKRDEDEPVSEQISVTVKRKGEISMDLRARRSKKLLAVLDHREMKAMVENGLLLGRKWLSAIA